MPPEGRAEYYVGVDIGGTFTDCALVDGRGVIHTGKAPTTPGDFADGFFASIADAAARLELSLDDVLARTRRLGHGTTVGINALVTRSGARVGLLTTKGHADALAIMDNSGRVTGASIEQVLHYAESSMPELVVRRADVREVTERVDSVGRVVVELDRAEAARAIRALVDDGVEALAICLLWSFANPAHELAVAALAHELAPDLFVCASHDVAPRIGEYPRTASTAFNAYIGPLMRAYVDRLAERARAHGYVHRLLFATATGGLTGLDAARRHPLRTLQSGPVAGVVATRLLGEAIAMPDAITTDMGGTTLDVSVIADGYEARTDSAVIERHQLHMRTVDINAIGAGGGSIAWIDEASGNLHVGPRSAGSRPGPACYAQGGLEPTVTDADLVLGILSPDGLLGGALPLDRSLAEEAIRRRVADPLGLDVEAAAAGIVELVDAQMEDLVRRITGQRGLDPRDFVLVGYGGGAAAHASLYGRDLGVRRLLIPLGNVASVWSAVGVAVGELISAVERPVFLRAPFDPATVAQIVRELEDEALLELAAEGVDRAAVAIRRSADLKYSLQVYDVESVVPPGELGDEAAMEAIVAGFDATYERQFGAGTGYREAGVIMTALRVEAVAARPAVDLSAPLPPASEPVASSRRVVHWWELGRAQETPVFAGAELGAGARIDGPAIIDFALTSAVVRPGQQASVDDRGNLVVSFGATPEPRQPEPALERSEAR